jgi:aerobic-type carbon monoxide dehydrogenase small subunit (CoxS/CutS family)
MQNPAPTPEEDREYLSGNLCRCGTYTNIMKAVLAAAEAAR